MYIKKKTVTINNVLNSLTEEQNNLNLYETLICTE